MAFLVGAAIPAALFLYSSYWSFAVRRALIDRTYRYHAASLGAITLVFASNLVVPPLPSVSWVSNLLFILTLVVIFVFVDSTIPVAKRSDPLLRSLLNWEKYRNWVRVVFASSLILWVLLDPSGLPPWGFVAILIPVVVGVPALLIGGRRSGDATLRGSLKWVGLALLFFVGAFMAYVIEVGIGLPTDNFITGYSDLPVGALLILAGYSFYRSAKSLAPLNHLEAVGLGASPTLETGAIRPRPSLIPR